MIGSQLPFAHLAELASTASSKLAKLTPVNQRLQSHYEIQKTKFIHKVGDQIISNEKIFIICKDLAGLINHIKRVRNCQEAHLKIAIDGGGGFLKICLTVQSDKSVDILGSSDERLENYENVKLLWSKLKINEFGYTIATDLKLANILTDIMSHSSASPCTWCTAAKDSLITMGEYRTIGSCIQNHENWMSNEGKKIETKVYKSCKNQLIFTGDEDTEVIEMIPPPELHLMLGTVSTLMKGMHSRFKDVCEKWVKDCHVMRQPAHGGEQAFAGNACRISLNKLDLLRSNCPVECLPFSKDKYTGGSFKVTDVSRLSFVNTLMGLPFLQ
ncbi:hypothetical protein QAD02_012771 [Eretmocerus hayati]|uniref:Uncharacterized protein n=1 Tax=Eretmocerus hayati TaxID=131215 RepID=A0ACC2P378_9HYME|nr:hypothetical protein QAD02_012771 [Eretmocerus hayati]